MRGKLVATLDSEKSVWERFGDVSQNGYPPGKETYPPKNGTFEDDFPFPQVGYVNSLEGMLWNIILGDTFGSKALMRFPKFFIAIDNYTLEFPDGEDWSFESDSCCVSPRRTFAA